MKPQDVFILLKISCLEDKSWQQRSIAKELFMSQSEISESVNRSKYAGLLDYSGKKVMKLAFLEFLKFGISYVFPQRPGQIVRGIPTAHSAPPLNNIIQSEEKYVWPSAKGNTRGQSIIPLYKSVPNAIINDQKLYELLALVDAVRVGRAREKEIALNEIKRRIMNENNNSNDAEMIL